MTQIATCPFLPITTSTSVGHQDIVQNDGSGSNQKNLHMAGPSSRPARDYEYHQLELPRYGVLVDYSIPKGDYSPKATQFSIFVQNFV